MKENNEIAWEINERINDICEWFAGTMNARHTSLCYLEASCKMRIQIILWVKNCIAE